MVRVWRAWARPRAIFWPQTTMTPVALARRCTRIGSDGGRGGGPAGRAPRSRATWAGVSGLGRVRSSTRVAGSKNISVCWLDADADQLAAEDLRGEQAVTAEADQAAAGDGPLDLDRVAVLGRWQWGGPGGDGPGGGELGQVVDRQVGADGLDPGATGGQVDQLGVGPEPDRHPGPGGPEPELPPGDPHVPRRRHYPVELHRAALPAAWSWRWALRCCRLWWAISAADRGERRRQPQLDQVPLGRRDWREPVGRSHRCAAVQGLVRTVGVVFGHPRIQRGLGRLDRGKRLVAVQQLAAQRLVEPLDLPRRGGRGRARSAGE